ncbi:MAG: hypothetical protein KDA75_07695, partial [Planctomycetaceae bacterium]|nr:hypothetical protein [Planctomycetaceae bacterium]
NVIGSNLFNLLGVLGVSGVVSPAGVTVSPQALALDVPVMVATTVSCLPVFLTGHRIARWEGGVFLLYYCVYIAWLVLTATKSESSSQFAWVILAFVTPLTVLTMLIGLWRQYRVGHRGTGLRAPPG